MAFRTGTSSASETDGVAWKRPLGFAKREDMAARRRKRARGGGRLERFVQAGRLAAATPGAAAPGLSGLSPGASRARAAAAARSPLAGGVDLQFLLSRGAA